jgi:hypothetical protein
VFLIEEILLVRVCGGTRARRLGVLGGIRNPVWSLRRLAIGRNVTGLTASWLIDAHLVLHLRAGRNNPKPEENPSQNYDRNQIMLFHRKTPALDFTEGLGEFQFNKCYLIKSPSRLRPEP